MLGYIKQSRINEVYVITSIYIVAQKNLHLLYFSTVDSECLVTAKIKYTILFNFYTNIMILDLAFQ